MRKVLFVIGACGLLIAGCGKSPEPTAPAAPTPAPKAETAPAAEPVKAVESKPVKAEAPVVVAPPVQPPPAAVAPVAEPVTKSVASGLSSPLTSGKAPTLADLPTDQLTRGLKEALSVGLKNAIAQLGKTDGFATNVALRIPMPEQLSMVDKGLRKIGQDKAADAFVATINHAAEMAVPAAAEVFGDAVKQMTISDAQTILKGSDDAATQYLLRTTGQSLKAKFKPIVQQATSTAGVTAAYKQLMDKAAPVTAFIKIPAVDLDEYVTDKAMGGLFQTVAVEEKKIRENPAARTTEVLKSVFGLLKK